MLITNLRSWVRVEVSLSRPQPYRNDEWLISFDRIATHPKVMFNRYHFVELLGNSGEEMGYAWYPEPVLTKNTCQRYRNYSSEKKKLEGTASVVGRCGKRVAGTSR